MDVAEKRTELAKMYYIRRFIDETLERVMIRLYEAWETLPETDRALIEQKRHQLEETLRSARTSFERGTQIERFLKELEQIDAVLDVAFDELIEGKTGEVFRNAGGPDQAATAQLIDVLQADPASFAPRRAAIAKGVEFALPQEAVEEFARVAPSVEESAEQDDTADVQFYTKVDFPAQIENDTEKEHPLIVQLVLERPETTRVAGVLDVSFADPTVPEMVEVAVTAPGFQEHTGIWTRTIAVYSYQNSQPAIFLLRLDDAAPQTRFLTVDFYHRGRNIGSFVFKTAVTGRQPTRTAPLSSTRPSGTDDADEDDATGEVPITQGTATVHRAVAGIQIPAKAPPPADVELRIVRVGAGTLHFTLHSARAFVGYHWKSMGEVELDGVDNPMDFFDRYFDRLNQLAAQPVDALEEGEAADYQVEIEDIGYELYKALFPDPLKAEYWKLLKLSQQIQEREDRALSLLITSDEPWIPWEMVKPYDDAHGDSDFLAGAFQLSRWLAGRGPMEELTIRAARLIAPKLDLEFVEEEQAYFKELEQRGIEVGEPIKTHADLLKLAQRGGVQVFHFATHGNFDGQHVDESPISLQDRPLLPRDLNRRRASGLAQDHPLIFFNTCHGARLGFDLTGLGGWAQRMVDEFGVTAFIGSHWEVNDRLASLFSRTFYTALLEDQTLGQAFQHARLAVRERQPANPTWLAYTLYGDPNSRIEWSIV